MGGQRKSSGLKDTGILGNERADLLAGKAAEKTAWSKFIFLAYLKLRVSEKFRVAKDEWHKDPDHHGSEEIPRRQPRSHASTELGTASPEPLLRYVPATGGRRCTQRESRSARTTSAGSAGGGTT
jgi:hypothetical protein